MKNEDRRADWRQAQELHRLLIDAALALPPPGMALPLSGNVVSNPRKLLDDIKSMSVADRQRLVNEYLAGLIRIVEPEASGSLHFTKRQVLDGAHNVARELLGLEQDNGVD